MIERGIKNPKYIISFSFPQTFLLEVFDTYNDQLMTKVTNDRPVFEISNFKGGHDGKQGQLSQEVRRIRIQVYAQNAKGSSQPLVLTETLKPPPSASAKSSAAAGGGSDKHAGVEGEHCLHMPSGIFLGEMHRHMSHEEDLFFLLQPGCFGLRAV